MILNQFDDLTTCLRTGFNGSAMIEMLYWFRDLLFPVFEELDITFSPFRRLLTKSGIDELKEAETKLFSGVKDILTSAIRKVESSLTQDGDLGGQK